MHRRARRGRSNEIVLSTEDLSSLPFGEALRLLKSCQGDSRHYGSVQFGKHRVSSVVDDRRDAAAFVRASSESAAWGSDAVSQIRTLRKLRPRRTRSAPPARRAVFGAHPFVAQTTTHTVASAVECRKTRRPAADWRGAGTSGIPWPRKARITSTVVRGRFASAYEGQPQRKLEYPHAATTPPMSATSTKPPTIVRFLMPVGIG